MVTYLAPGTVLMGNYRIERILGQGGLSIKYLATDLSLSRLVAIKEFYPKDLCSRSDGMNLVAMGSSYNHDLVEWLKAKFLKEARSIARLNNPYVIRIYSIFEANNTAYYVMEYIDGVNLRELVSRMGPHPLGKALEYIGKIGNALEYVHHNHINHLNINPSNILIRKTDDNPILIDFGLQKQYNAQGNQTSTILPDSSHGFAPLEHYNSVGINELNATSDVYSLAATLYFLLTGMVPPEASKLPETGLTFPNHIPEYIQRAIVRGMSFSRSNRQQSVRSFLSELGNSVSHGEERTVMTHQQFESSVTPRPQGMQRQTRVASAPVETSATIPSPQKESSRLKTFIIIGVAALLLILATVWITLSVSKTKTIPVTAENLEITEAPAYNTEALPEEPSPKAVKPAPEAPVKKLSVKEAATRVLNDSPYPIAPGHHLFKGKADGNLPILVYIDVDSRGNISGKMAYESTLRKYGDTPDHYMYINGSFNGNRLSLSVDDNKGNLQDWNLSVRENGMKYVLTGDAYSYTKNKTFSINVSGK